LARKPQSAQRTDHHPPPPAVQRDAVPPDPAAGANWFTEFPWEEIAESASNYAARALSHEPTHFRLASIRGALAAWRRLLQFNSTVRQAALRMQKTVPAFTDAKDAAEWLGIVHEIFGESQDSLREQIEAGELLEMSLEGRLCLLDDPARKLWAWSRREADRINQEKSNQISQQSSHTAGDLSGTIMGDVAATFHAVADDALKRGLTLAEFKQAVDDKLAAKAQAARETTARATVEPRPRTIADAKAEALAIGDTTLLGQLVKYEARLANIELPPAGLTSPEQARAAGRLSTIYRDLRVRQTERGLKPLSKDDRVREAERLSVDFYRKHPQPKVKSARSSSRRGHQPRTASLT
jgi:hypothetical protein